ncbi:MAG: hypothetical protein RMY29_015500 [Nostoc sp. CreGUA01]|nr:hypothetical protein [Nostoc sp. CreGUA01]
MNDSLYVQKRSLQILASLWLLLMIENWALGIGHWAWEDSFPFFIIYLESTFLSKYYHFWKKSIP